MGNSKAMVNLSLKCLIALMSVFVFFKWIYGYISMWIMDSPIPLHVPDKALKIYITFTILGILIYVTSSEERKRDFIEPVQGFLRGEQGGVLGLVRIIVLILIPVVAGFYTYSKVVPKAVSQAGIRIMHPTMPRQFEDMESPARHPVPEAVKAYIAKEGLEGVSFEEAKNKLAEKNMMDGRVFFAKNCRPCHGMQANGKGPMAWGWRLKPADFTDPGTLPTIVEPYAFWRVCKGGPGLPSASTPWDSAMPIWDLNIPEEMRWQVLLGEYDLAGVGPRQPEGEGGE